MLYLADSAGDDGAALSTLRGWMAAINRVHVEAGLPAPGDDPAMTLFLRGMSRKAKGPRVRKVSALRIADLRIVCRSLDATAMTPVDARDRSVLVLHRQGLDDGAIARLDWDDIVIGPRTARVRVRAPRTSVPEKVLTLRRQRDASTCPVRALEDWREVAGEWPPVTFSKVLPSGARSELRLSAQNVGRIRQSRLNALVPNQDGDAVSSAIEILGGPSSESMRDRALLLLGFAGAFRRVDLSRLTWSSVTRTKDGLVVHLARSKTDVAGRGADIGIPPGKSALTCPVTAVEAWRARYRVLSTTPNIAQAPVFPLIGRAGRLAPEPLTPGGVAAVVRRRAEGAALAGRWGGRSLRAGFISTAADLDIPLELIARQSRHATLDTLMLYIRSDDPFRRNPASRVGL